MAGSPAGSRSSNDTTPPDDEEERPRRLVESVVSLSQALVMPEPEYRSLYVGGGMPLGYYGIVHGPGGIGKTRELLRMIVLRALKRPWHCWEPSDEPFKPLVLSFELGRAPIARILEAIARGVGGDEALETIADQVNIVGYPEYLGPLQAGPAALVELIEVIEKYGANFALIDSMSEVRGGFGNDTPEEYTPAIETFKAAARKTQAHLCVVHHNRRLPPGAKFPDAPADQIRGPATFVNSSRWACGMDNYRGKARITWHRVSFGPSPDSSYFKIDAAGIPQDDTAPEGAAGVGEMNRAKVLGVIPAVGGVTRKEIQGATGLSASAVGEHLRELVRLEQAIQSGSGRNVRYHLPSSLAPELDLPGSTT